MSVIIRVVVCVFWEQLNNSKGLKDCTLSPTPRSFAWMPNFCTSLVQVCSCKGNKLKPIRVHNSMLTVCVCFIGNVFIVCMSSRARMWHFSYWSVLNLIWLILLENEIFVSFFNEFPWTYKETKMQFDFIWYAEVYGIICSLRGMVQALFPQLKPTGK